MKRNLPVKQFNAIKKVFKQEKHDELKVTINARAVHEWLGVKSKFADWIKRRVDKYGFEEGLDFCSIKTTVPTFEKANEINYLTSTEYHCTPDMVKQLAMIENSDMGKLARLYFLDCEKIANDKLEKLEARGDTKKEFRMMTDAILDNARIDGVKAEAQDYQREANLINRVIFNLTSLEYKRVNHLPSNAAIRDWMEGSDLKLISVLQKANASFLQAGLDVETRESMLRTMVQRKLKL